MSRPNPVKSFKHAPEQYQKRHYNCDNYSKCLDKAAKKKWANFTCLYCVVYKKYIRVRNQINEGINNNKI